MALERITNESTAEQLRAALRKADAATTRDILGHANAGEITAKDLGSALLFADAAKTRAILDSTHAEKLSAEQLVTAKYLADIGKKVVIVHYQSLRASAAIGIAGEDGGDDRPPLRLPLPTGGGGATGLLPLPLLPPAFGDRYQRLMRYAAASAPEMPPLLPATDGVGVGSKRRDRPMDLHERAISPLTLTPAAAPAAKRGRLDDIISLTSAMQTASVFDSATPVAGDDAGSVVASSGGRGR